MGSRSSLATQIVQGQPEPCIIWESRGSPAQAEAGALSGWPGASHQLLSQFPSPSAPAAAALPAWDPQSALPRSRGQQCGPRTGPGRFELTGEVETSSSSFPTEGKAARGLQEKG